MHNLFVIKFYAKNIPYSFKIGFTVMNENVKIIKNIELRSARNVLDFLHDVFYLIIV